MLGEYIRIFVSGFVYYITIMVVGFVDSWVSVEVGDGPWEGYALRISLCLKTYLKGHNPVGDSESSG